MMLKSAMPRIAESLAIEYIHANPELLRKDKEQISDIVDDFADIYIAFAQAVSNNKKFADFNL